MTKLWKLNLGHLQITPDYGPTPGRAEYDIIA